MKTQNLVFHRNRVLLLIVSNKLLSLFYNIVKEILDYSEFVEDSAHADRDSISGGLFYNTHFFNRVEPDLCPFCKIFTQVVHQKETDQLPGWLDGGRYSIGEKAWSCKECGWWKVRIDKDTTGTIDAVSAVIKNAVLKKYDLSDKDVPITILSDYLKDKYEDVIHIHHRKMEQLVQSVFSEHFNCEVIHVGRTSDGGIDLILVNSSSPVVIQVKRRKKINKAEPVSAIRDFLGAAQLKQSRNLIYVTTYDRYSHHAIKATKDAIDLNLVDSYELYDFNRFQDILKLTKTQQERPAWTQHINVN